MTEPTAIFVKMVERYAELWHNGRIPEDRVSFVAQLLEFFMPEGDRQIGGVFTVAEWLRERDRVAAQLVMATDCLARSRDTGWKN